MISPRLLFSLSNSTITVMTQWTGRCVPIKISHFCFALAHLSIMLDFAAAPCCGKQTVQCSWAPQDSERGILIPFLSPFGTSQIYLVIKKGKAPHHLRRIGKWERKLCQNPTCRLRNTTGQEMNPQQVKVLTAQRSLINSDSDTLLVYTGTAPISLSHFRERALRAD